MNIEKLREEAAAEYAGYHSLSGHTHPAFVAGAKWEHERSKWVNVEDGLPPAGQDVLIEVNSGEILVDFIAYDGDWKEFTYKTVIRWTEIPKI